MGLISRVSSRTYRKKQKIFMDTKAINQGFFARKCSSSGRLIGAKDHGSIQINISDVDEQGQALQTHVTYAICGDLRSMGESDDAINRLCKQDNIIPKDKWLEH